MWNVAKRDGTLMLGDNVEPLDALLWLAYYLQTYPAGKPYPNGKGCYPDFGFHVVKV